MAITVEVLEDGSRNFMGVKKLVLIPYTDPDTLGAKAYQLEHLLADSVSLTDDDNTITARDSELRDEPELENVILGKKQFAAISLDAQDTIMKELMGWSLDETTKILTAPTTYKPLWVRAEVHFNSTTDILVVPRLKMNSKMTIASLKTSSGEIAINGTAYTGKIYKAATGTDAILAPAAIVPEGKNFYPNA